MAEKIFRIIKNKAVLTIILALVIAGTALKIGVPPEEHSEKNIVNYAVKPGDTFSVVMEKFGFSAETMANILETAEDIYDFKKIKAGNLFRFISGEENIIEEIRYDIDEEKIVIIKNGENELSVVKEKILYEKEIITTGNTITSSLYVDASEIGVPPKTILDLAEIFAWDIDFIVDIREGDSFKIIYEKLSRDEIYVGPGKIIAARFENQDKEFLAFYFSASSTENQESGGQYYDTEGRALAREFLKSPLNYAYISSGFSYNRLNPVTRSSWGAHRAIDYKASIGTPVSVTGNGRVIYAGWGSQRGLYVHVDHGGVYRTLYAHLSNLARGVRTGGSVKQGQVIGYVGSTGLSTGPHLHYEMKKYGNYINPLLLKLPPGDPLPEDTKEEFGRLVEELLLLLN